MIRGEESGSVGIGRGEKDLRHATRQVVIEEGPFSHRRRVSNVVDISRIT